MLPSRKPTAAEKAKLIVMDQQLSALRADGYRLTLMDSTGAKPPFNLGKGKGPGGEEKFFTADEVKKKVRLLSAKNAQGYNVYITPIDPEKHYLVIDDLRYGGHGDLRRAGYTPALVQRTSESEELPTLGNSYQAVLILPKNEVSHHAGNSLFKDLNREHGDPNISGFVHPFRLAGFANKKPARRLPDGRSPLVKIEHHEHQIDQKATEKARQIDAEMGEAARPKASTVARAPVISDRMSSMERDAAESFYHRRKDWWGEDADLSKIDRELAVHLRAQGFGKEAVRDAIDMISPDVEGRHPRLDEYLESKIADLYPEPAEQKPENPRPAPAGAAPRPR